MLILGSKSPRREELLRGLDIPFRVQAIDVDEQYPDSLSADEVAEYISREKAAAYTGLAAADVLLTADTVVVVDDKIYGKPHSADDARRMLRLIQNRVHKVITGVTVRSVERTISFSAVTLVRFTPLTDAQIDYYIDRYKPYDKAGAYGIQEWIGFVGVDWIEGSYFNVMGLPTSKVYSALKSFGL